MKKNITNAIFLMCSLNISYAGSMEDLEHSPPHIYLGFFGAGGALSNFSALQFGSAYYADTKGGPLAVNASGQTNARAEWFIGGQVGYEWQERSLQWHSQWNISPGIELEGFYIGKNTVVSEELNNSTTRLTEHDFNVHYPMESGIGLINAIFTFKHHDYGSFKPYIAAGIGAGVVSISNAISTQTSPLEPNINHYNSHASDNSTVFAVQPKVGFRYTLRPCLDLFAEYRFLYLSGSNFTFGSTVYPSHVATSNWNVMLGSQYYNMGVLGVRYLLS